MGSRRWRDYQSASGARPVKQFFDRLADEEAAAIVAAMKDISTNGLVFARHLRGEIYEVRADAGRRTFRLLFAQETKFILLALCGFSKTTQKTPARELKLAEARLRDWRHRGANRRREGS